MLRVSGRCVWFMFDELIGKLISVVDYIEFMCLYDVFIVMEVFGMIYW